MKGLSSDDDTDNVTVTSGVVELEVPDGSLGVTVLPVNGEAGRRPSGVCGGLVVVKVKGLTRGGSPLPKRRGGEDRPPPIFNIGDIIVAIGEISLVGMEVGACEAERSGASCTTIGL